jgi:hypothetical protein
MRNIAVFYHTRLDGGEPPINTTYALELLCEQMNCLYAARLDVAASEIIVGVTASSWAALAARSALSDKAQLIVHPEGSKSELTTLSHLQRWLPGHEDWYVFYHHAKGVTKPPHGIDEAWRRCMTRHLVVDWRKCVSDLDAGCDAVGCHWLLPEKHPGMAPLWATYKQFPDIIRTPYFGGNFWFAKASYLLTLPKLPENAACRQDFFLAESWIGMGPHRPTVKDYHDAWPSTDGCHRSATQ